jgi:hypothetical protein
MQGIITASQFFLLYPKMGGVVEEYHPPGEQSPHGLISFLHKTFLFYTMITH